MGVEKSVSPRGSSPRGAALAGCAPRGAAVNPGALAGAEGARRGLSRCFSRPQKSYEHLAKIRVAREAPPECNCPPGNRHSLEISVRLVTLGVLISCVFQMHVGCRGCLFSQQLYLG